MHDAIQLDDYIPYRLSILSRAISQSLARQYSRQFNISIHEWRILTVLAGSPRPLSSNAIGQQADMDKVQMSRALNRLLETGLLEKEQDGRDRRRVLLRMTGPGRDIYRQIVPIALNHQAELLSVLTPEEHRQLTDLIEKLHVKAIDL